MYQSQDFHYCGTTNNAIQNWSDPHEVQFCQLENLAESVQCRLFQYQHSHLRSLATETEYVRGKLAAHANDLISLGVEAFRIDAAKRRHIQVFLI